MSEIRLDIGWSYEEWLCVLSAESRLVWVGLLCYAKGYGANGRVKTIPTSQLAAMLFVGEESTRQLLRAATTAGALSVVDGHWVVANWQRDQGDATNADRQRRFKAKRKIGNGGNALPISSSQIEPVEPTGNGGNALPVSDLFGVTVLDYKQEVLETLSPYGERREREIQREREREGEVEGKREGERGKNSCMGLVDHLPSECRSLELEQTWNEYMLHRKEKKKSPYTQTGLKTLAKQLVGRSLAASDICDLLRTVMASNWEGIPVGVLKNWTPKKSGRMPTQMELEVSNR